MANIIYLQSDSYDGRYLLLQCNQHQNINNNTSTITWVLTSIGGSNSYYSTGPTTVTINGVQVYTKPRVSYTQEVFPAAKGKATGTVIVPHNTDGSKEITVSLSTAIYVGEHSVTTKSSKWTLDKIPRAATITSVDSFTDETNPIIFYNNQAGTSATLSLYLYDSTETTAFVSDKALSNNSNRYNLALSDAERVALRKAATAATLPLKFKIKTVIGGQEYWSAATSATMTLVNHTPVAEFQVSDSNIKTVALTGNNQVFIKGYSYADYSITALGRKEATISSYEVKVGEQTKASNTGTFENVTSGEFTYSVTDNRGVKTENKATYSLINYIPITCELSVSPPSTGGELEFTIKGKYFNNSFGAKNNTIDVQYIITEQDTNSGSWVVVGSSNIAFANDTYTTTITATGLDYRKTYKVLAWAKDEIKAVYSNSVATKTMPIFDWGENDFNFNVPVSFNGVPMTDFIIEDGVSDSWRYRKWNNGCLECWRRYAIQVNVATAWGSLFSSGYLSETNLTYPIEFVAEPTLNVTLSPRSAGAMLMVPGGAGASNIETAAQTGAFELVRGTALNNGLYILNYYAIGRWK